MNSWDFFILGCFTIAVTQEHVEKDSISMVAGVTQGLWAALYDFCPRPHPASPGGKEIDPSCCTSWEAQI